MKTKIRNKISTPVFSVFALIIFGATIGTAAPGDLDPTFGIGGKVIDGSGYASYDVAIQPDGKIVAVGVALGGTQGTSIAVARYNIDGSPDTTFGGTGRVVVDRYGIAMDVAIQPDGKIVVAIRNNDGEVNGEILRLNPNGSLDASFGTNGILAGFLPSVLATLPDGKILIAQAANVFRLNADGSFDTTFGPCQPGVSTIHYPYNRIESVIQPDGKILTEFAPANGGFGAFRCNTNGTLDTTFGSGGIVITPVNGSAATQSIALQTDGKIIVAGQSQTSDWKLTLARYNQNGSLDTTFGTGGVVSAPIGTSPMYSLGSVAIQNDDKIVASTNENNNSLDFALVRFNANGSLDPTFGGGDGIAAVDFNNSQDDAYGMAIDSRGRAVVVGGSGNGYISQFAIARILLAPPSTPFDFDGDRRADVSVFRPSDRVWYLNQSTNGFAATQFGLSTDRITPADYDGDGKTDIAVYRDGTWWRINSSNSTVVAVPFGLASDIPVPGDYTGDGRDELAVYRSGTWWTFDLTNNQAGAIQFGLATDKPVAADYDGDGRTDQAVYRDGEWHLNRSTLGYSVVNFGLAADRPVVGDYDGDGKADQTVYRDGVWYLLRSQGSFTAFQFGVAADTPAPADYDGDGKTDAAVYRDGTWWILQSTAGVVVQQFGLAGDKPIPAAYLP